MEQTLVKRFVIIGALCIAASSALGLAGCSARAQTWLPANGEPSVATREFGGASPFQHVVIVIQENRTVDNLFQFLRGARTAREGLNWHGQVVPLQPVSLTAKYDMQHHHVDWTAAYNDGAMNGWNRENCNGQCPANPAYGYVPQSEVQPYYTMAERYAFADELFQTNQGPSLPAHQYLVSGTSTNVDGSFWRVAENAKGSFKHVGGCDSAPGTTALMIDTIGQEGNPVFPCFDRSSIFTLLDAAQISWRFYQAHGGAGSWNSVDALKPIWENKSEFSSAVVSPSSRLLTDIQKGHLAGVVFVTPTAAASDHASVTDGMGPSWVASIVNAVGTSAYWKNTAIIVVWDDWGGWYDHEKPATYNSYELGMRVPAIVISPYSRHRYVSHVHYEFGSLLKFVEQTFGLPSLRTTDVRSNNLSDCFDFTSPPRKFKKIPAPYSGSYFLHQPPGSGSPDDD